MATWKLPYARLSSGNSKRVHQSYVNFTYCPVFMISFLFSSQKRSFHQERSWCWPNYKGPGPNVKFQLLFGLVYWYTKCRNTPPSSLHSNQVRFSQKINFEKIPPCTVVFRGASPRVIESFRWNFNRPWALLHCVSALSTQDCMGAFIQFTFPTSTNGDRTSCKRYSAKRFYTSWLSGSA